MNEKIRQKLYDAKMGLVDLADSSFKDMKLDAAFVQRRIQFALEGIDDALEGRVRFQKRRNLA